MSTKLSRAMGLALAITLALAGVAAAIILPPMVVGSGLNVIPAMTLYALAMTFGVAVATAGGLAILRWLDTRDVRRFKDDH